MDGYVQDTRHQQPLVESAVGPVPAAAPAAAAAAAKKREQPKKPKKHQRKENGGNRETEWMLGTALFFYWFGFFFVVVVVVAGSKIAECLERSWTMRVPSEFDGRRSASSMARRKKETISRPNKKKRKK